MTNEERVRERRFALERLLREVVDDCQASEASVWELRPETGELELVLNIGPARERIVGLRVPISESVVGLVATIGEATSIGPGERRHPLVDERAGTETTAMIAAPIVTRAGAVGVISAINPITTDSGAADSAATLFSPEQLETLRWKAYVAGLIFEHG